MATKDNGSLNIDFEKVINYSSLFLPFIFIIYGLTNHNGGITKLLDSQTKIEIMLILGFSWIITGLACIFSDKIKNSKRIKSLSIIFSHLIATCFFIFIVPFDSPLTLAWILLLVPAYLLGGTIAMSFSVLLYILTITASILLDSVKSPETVSSAGVSILSMGISSMIIGIILSRLEKDRKDAKKSKDFIKEQDEIIADLINNLSEGLISIDTRGRIKIYNAASLNFLNINGDPTGKKLGSILQLKDSNDNEITLLKDLKQITKVIHHDDAQIDFSDNDIIRIDITISPIWKTYSIRQGGEKIAGYSVILRDITKTKSLEEEKDEFISVVSHELRTPITIAEGTLSNGLLMVEKGIANQEKLVSNIKTAHSQINDLSRMINDLSTLSRAQRGVGQENEDIDLKQLAEKLYHEYTPQAETKGLRLILDTSHNLKSISTSRLYLEELLQNLITNAIKYTEKGDITLSIKQKDDLVTFSVKDTGIGISRSDQKKIFQKFYRSEDYRTRETSGTGLGLYVSAKLSEKMNTKIELVSRLNHGSTFYFSLPISE